jgi:hypothetical protein
MGTRRQVNRVGFTHGLLSRYPGQEVGLDSLKNKKRGEVMSKVNLAAICLALILSLGLASVASAQCGRGSGYMHDQHMGYSGHMGSGQMGMYGQAPVQPDPNAVAPGYAAPVPPVSGYTEPQQDSSGPGQMMGRGGAGSGHGGHMGH